MYYIREKMGSAIVLGNIWRPLGDFQGNKSGHPVAQSRETFRNDSPLKSRNWGEFSDFE
jgi:hypothetical protein